MLGGGSRERGPGADGAGGGLEPLVGVLGGDARGDHVRREGLVGVLREPDGGRGALIPIRHNSHRANPLSCNLHLLVTKMEIQSFGICPSACMKKKRQLYSAAIIMHP